MVYEKKAQSALEEFLNAIYYEEGRLALINKLGPALSDEDKATATQLITAQRANLDRLLELFKKDLEPLMSDICKNGEAMAPLVSKLVSTGTQVHQVEESTNSNEAVMIADAPSEMTSVSENGEGAAIISSDEPSFVAGADTPASDATVVADTTTDVAIVTDGSATEVASDASEVATDTNLVGSENSDAAVVTESTAMEGVGDNAPAAEITSSVAASTEGNGGEVVTGEVSTTAVEGTSDAPATETAEETTPFVLSPMDEDVAPVPTKEEVKAAEEGVAAADQQLQAIEGMKTDIINDTNLTDIEKTVSLGKYTRMTDAAVRAILVTKAQYEKLLTSRETQKTLLKPTEENSVEVDSADTTVAEVASEEVVATLPDFSATDTATSAEGETNEASAPVAAADSGSDSVIPAIVGGDSASTEQATATEATASNDNGGGFLPTIETGTDTSEAPVNDAPVEGALVLPMINNDSAPAEQAAPATEATDGVLELPTAGAIPAESAPAEAQSGANELQAMIEQANALYKEGKTVEAQALFEKIGTMNKESTGESTNSEVTDAAKVLVK